MRVSIASVTTAYNAAHILPRQIEALLNQTRPLQEIIVIDNGSTDNTVAMLAERYPQVIVLQQPKNVGAAGGSAAGIAYAAFEKRHDWIWNFDDDSVPDTFALEALLSGAEDISADEKIGMFAPLPVHRASGTYYPPMLWRDGYVTPSQEMLEKPIWFADLVIASGWLLRSEAAEEIGLTRADFFMDFFDFEYCLRLRSKGYKIAVVKACTFSHGLGDARTFRLFGFSHTWSGHSPWREYYMSRNITYSVFSLYPTWKTKLFLARFLLRHALAIVLFGEKKLAALKKMFQGVCDGIHGKLGIRFLP